MFALTSLSKYLFGDSSKAHIVELPVGVLYLVRPSSPKGYSELIYKDAAAYIRRTAQDFQYNLVIQRAYEEGEEDLEAEEGEVGDGTSGRDERVFALDQEIKFRVELKESGETVLAWRDVSGDDGDLFEFVCEESSTRPETVTSFELVAAQCQFERKYRRSHQQATDAELGEFAFEDEPAIPQASPISSPTSRTPAGSSSPALTRSLNDVRELGHGMVRDSAKQGATPQKQIEATPTKAPVSREAPASKEVLANEDAELHLFDFPSGTFILQDDNVQAMVSDVGRWKYWLQISGNKGRWLGQEVMPDINPVFNLDYLSFIFNHYTEDGSGYSWLLKFKDRQTVERFQRGLMQALWEHGNEIKWQKNEDKDYVLNAFNDLVIEKNDDKREAEAAEEDEEEEEWQDAEGGASQPHEEYDEDESEDEEERLGEDGDGHVNSQLAVGAKVDRSFVVRGDKIGVFKHTADNQLEFTTSINKVATPKGKSFSPQKIMLHAQDKDMILQDQTNPNSLYRMDLEYGKVVDEWKVHETIPVNFFTPASKFAQATGEQTFLGLSSNALYRIDPRLAGTKLVDADLKNYKTKVDFSAAATTEKGHIAVASNHGEIRLYNSLGKNAKTAIPALGDPIIGLDVSADGHWVLATTRTYLLLIDAIQPEGDNAGKLGFERSFPKNAKPAPTRLALTPSHVAQFQHETGAPLSFTPARFNTGEGKNETTIITATGPFVVTWSLKKIEAKRKDPYSIKRYAEMVKADNFRFGSDRNIVVALPNEVDMVSRKALQRPTRESIMAAPVATPRRSGGRGGYLRRDEVVASPY